MRSSLLSRTLVSVCLLLCVVSSSLGGSDEKEKKNELEIVLERLRQAQDAESSEADANIPEDAGPFFDVKEVRIRGNSLVSTADLLKGLTRVYRDKVGDAVGNTYDLEGVYDVLVEPGKARTVSARSIQGFTRYLLSVYDRMGYMGIYVYVPAKAVTDVGKLVDDVLEIDVLEGRVKDIQVSRYDFERNDANEAFLRDSVLKGWSPIKSGQVINKGKLNYFVRLLNLNPDRYVSAVVSRGEDPCSLKLGYDVYESNPWHFYLQTDDSGTKDRQWAPKVGLVNTNVTGADDRFSVMYQAPWEKGIEEEYAVFGSYDFPVFSPCTRLNIYSGYSQFDITSNVGQQANFIGNGSFVGGVLSVNVAQIELGDEAEQRRHPWFVDLTGSVSYERSKVTPSLGLASDVDMDLWGVGVNVHRSDPNGSTTIVFNRVQSMGGSSRSDFEQARSDADPDFAIYYVTAACSRYLDPRRVSRFSTSFRVINSNERLVPAKMTTFGGLYSVRGYEEDEIVADGGLLFSAQYELDLVKLGQSPEGKEVPGRSDGAPEPLLKKLAPLAFLDIGRARIKNPVAGEKEIRELCSGGIGAVVELRDDFSGAIYCGWALRGTDETDRGDAQLNLSFMKRF